MVPKIHAKGGSFKGAAAYLLHDKGRADSAERVAWTESRNLAVDDPDIGWRIMAATAMDQGRLKAEAGVKNTGRKSHRHVLHISLAWHPDQAPTREDMTAAADQALAAIGAGDRQALIIAHNDEKHSHLHLLINRVSPLDGRHLSSSNDRLKLSKWAENYERDGGRIYCEDRVVNNAMRAKGDYVKGARDVARHIYEAQPPAPANDNDRIKGVIADQRKKDAALALRGRNLAKLQSLAWEKLAAAHRDRKASLARQLNADIAKARNQVQDEFRPKWRELNRTQESERETFAELETSFFGRASNMAKTVRLTAQDIGGDTSGIIGRTFGILTNAGKRREYFEMAQERAQKALQRDQDQKAGQAAKTLKDAQAGKAEANRAVYMRQREELAASQKIERQKLQADWAKRTRDREAAFEAVEQQPRRQPGVAEAHSKPDSVLTTYERALLQRYLRGEFDQSRETPAREQDKDHDRDDGQER